MTGYQRGHCLELGLEGGGNPEGQADAGMVSYWRMPRAAKRSRT
jgi:hypothetical protein